MSSCSPLFSLTPQVRGGSARGRCLLALALACGLAASAAETIHREVKVAARDGVKLATDVFLPAGEGRFPTVLIRTPYDKGGGAGIGRDGAARGYAVVVQDTRGRFASEGENLPFHMDGPDGEDTLAWIREQPWSNGVVGTWGGSAVAITQYQLAARGTPPVRAQFLVVGAPNLYEGLYIGGVFRKSLIEDWLRGSRFSPHALDVWVAHPRYDDYWRERDASLTYDRIQAAAVHIGGWWDIFSQLTVDGFVGYQTRGGEGARGRQKLIMGPWAHQPLTEKAGELAFPNGAQPPGDSEDAWRWFDHWLMGKDNGADKEPAVTYYVIGDVEDPDAPGNTWRVADQWPPAPQTWTRHFFHADGSLSTRAPEGDGSLSYTYDPKDPAPTVGGIQLTIPAGPKDQRGVEERPDVLVFTTAPLEAPVEVTGSSRARLWIMSDAPDTDFVVRVCDVYPDGRSYNLCEGVLRARFREGLDKEKLLEPGRPVQLAVDLWPTSVIFNRGHRIRVHVTSSSSPGYDPNPNTGEAFRASDRARPARNTLFVSADRPSWIELPIVKSGAK